MESTGCDGFYGWLARRKVKTTTAIDDFSDVAAWGTTDNFGIFSSLVESTLCVHVIAGEDMEMKTEAYSKARGALHAMHVRWETRGAGHVDMYEGSTFAEDTKLRAANFVRNAQKILFTVKKGKIAYEETSILPEHGYINRSGLKLLSILAAHPNLRT